MFIKEGGLLLQIIGARAKNETISLNDLFMQNTFGVEVDERFKTMCQVQSQRLQVLARLAPEPTEALVYDIMV